MIREYVKYHPFNGTQKRKSPNAPHYDTWFVRGVILCDGKIEGFATWDRSLERAQKKFDTYLNPRCKCVHGSDVSKCPIHKRGFRD